MSETAASLSELPPHALGFYTAVQQLVDNPPEGFGQPYIFEPTDHDKVGYASQHAVSSDERVPGYPRESVKSFEYREGSDFVLAFGELLDEPLEDGTPTLRDYTLYYDGTISSMRSRCPDPEKIQNTANHVVGLVALLGGLGDYRDRLTRVIGTTTEEWLRGLKPESMGDAVHLSVEEVEALNRKLEALTQTDAE